MSADEIEEGEVESEDDEIQQANDKSKYSMHRAHSNQAKKEQSCFTFRNKSCSGEDSSSESDGSEDGQLLKKIRIDRPAEDTGNRSLTKKLNVWSDVIIEQQMSSCIKSSGNLNGPEAAGIQRGVESYKLVPINRDLEISLNGETHHGDGPLQEELWNVYHDGESRNSVKDRLGTRKRVRKQHRKKSSESGRKKNHQKNQMPSRVTSADDEQTVAQFVAAQLDEPKVYLMTRIVAIVGKEKSLDLLHKTQDIEVVGGLKRQDGIRRTAGGVFIQLLKADPDITKEMIKDIFLIENETQKEFRKKLRREHRIKKFGTRGLTKKLNRETEIKAQEQQEVDEFDLMEEPDIQIGVL